MEGGRVHTDETGHWEWADLDDPLPLDVFPQCLCLRCGVRMWFEGVAIHDEFHESLGQ